MHNLSLEAIRAPFDELTIRLAPLSVNILNAQSFDIGTNADVIYRLILLNKSVTV